MKTNLKIIVSIIVTVIGIFGVIGMWCYANLQHNRDPYIKDFELVSNDYDKIVVTLCDYYDKENYTDDICVYIDNNEYVISYKESTIDISDDVKQSLKKICETSYSGHYDYVWISENHVIFWQDETKIYGVMYTEDFEESENNIEGWYEGVEFKQINGKWYELGNFGI